MECVECHKPASGLHYAGKGEWVCRHCYTRPPPMNICQLHERSDIPGATTAHIRDLESRRLDTRTGKMYYDKGKMSYFYGH
jgi:hypothetical protein